MPLTVILIIIISFPSPTLSFIPDLKPSFCTNPSHCSLSFSSSGLTTWIPQTFTVTSEHIRFYFLVFFLYFLVVSVRQIKLTRVGFRAHVKIASRIVSFLRARDGLYVGASWRIRRARVVVWCRAGAVQSLLQLLGEKDLYDYYRDTYKVHGVDWTVDTARRVLDAWRRKFTQVRRPLAHFP